ncbi:Secretory peroxidase [Sesbania bispinosa]|nr:Secretory peroxidase [Sesbania bispinosa]
MASSHLQNVLVVVTMASLMIPSHATLIPHFYDKVCPQALPVIKSVVQRAINRERRMGASLLRLHFHDCFVNGCDGSVLLDDTRSFTGEKNALPNKNSLRGFEVIDEIKAAVDKACKHPVVSCADILAIAARDSVAIKRCKKCKQRCCKQQHSCPIFQLLTASFKFQVTWIGPQGLVALSGGHTIGFAKCTTFRSRIYNATNRPQLCSLFAEKCPRIGGDNNLAPFDPTPTTVDTMYYKELMCKKGLLHSDQELFKGSGGESDRLVELYSRNPFAFAQDFKASMIKMGNMKPLTGNMGEIRGNCRRVN